MKYEIDYVGPSWNKIYAINNHWTRKKIVDEARRDMGYLLRQKKIPPCKTRVDIRIEEFRPRPIDSDNVCSKIILDCLKDIGVLKNDSPAFVRWVSTKSEKGERKTIIEIKKI